MIKKFKDGDFVKDKIFGLEGMIGTIVGDKYYVCIYDLNGQCYEFSKKEMKNFILWED